MCRLADVTPSVEGQPCRPSISVPTTGNSIDSPLSERILGLVTSLSDRVKHMEAKLDTLRPGKRPLSQEDDSNLPEQDTSSSLSTRRPPKQPRISKEKMTRVSVNTEASVLQADTETNPGVPEFDAEVEDAAAVLEFLAWGRLKDSNITTGLRDTPGDSTLGSDKDITQTTQTWGLSSSSVSGSQSLHALPVSQIQEILPSQAQAVLLVEYHSKWLLFMHCAFHAQTLRQELEKFYLNDNGVISMTSSGLQWAALLFAVMCGSMTCARQAQILDWGFPEGWAYYQYVSRNILMKRQVIKAHWQRSGTKHQLSA